MDKEIKCLSGRVPRSDELVEIVARDLIRARGADIVASDEHWPDTVAHYRAMKKKHGIFYTRASSLVNDAMRDARAAIESYQKATGDETRGDSAVAELVEAARGLIALFEEPPLSGDPPMLDIGPILVAVGNLATALAKYSGPSIRDPKEPNQP